jgi:hypothetical protein
MRTSLVHLQKGTSPPRQHAKPHYGQFTRSVLTCTSFDHFPIAVRKSTCHYDALVSCFSVTNCRASGGLRSSLFATEQHGDLRLRPYPPIINKIFILPSARIACVPASLPAQVLADLSLFETQRLSWEVPSACLQHRLPIGANRSLPISSTCPSNLPRVDLRLSPRLGG